MTAIVFDLDGTLVDSAPDLHAAANKVLAGEGLDPIDLATITSFIGNGLPKLVERVMEKRSIPVTDFPRLYGAMQDFYNAAPCEISEPFPGVPALLERLKAAGHRLGVCTNKPEEPALLLLDLLGLAPYFDVVVGGDALDAKKPDPAPLRHAIEQLGGGPGLYIGDSEVDAETARNAGVTFALFSGGYRKSPIEQMPHDHLFEHFDQVDAIVAGLLGDAAE